MAGITMTPPSYSGDINEDINIFIRRFRGFLDSVGINPVGAQRNRAIGMFRSCLQGPAGEWYDENILGKNWKLNNIFDNHGQGGMGALRGRTMAQMIASNSFRLHSLASTFANIPGNNAVTVGDVIARMIPAEAFDEDWTNAGGEPTDDHVNGFAGNNNPIVLNGIHIGQAIDHFKNNYTTVLEEKRKVHFGNLEQGNEPVGEFYKKLKRSGSLLNFGNEIIEHHFFKGLSPENQLEVERIGADKSINDLVKALGCVEKRKAEMKLGLSKRTGGTDYQTQVQPTSSGSHKPSHSGFSPEDVDRMIKSITEKVTQNFQTQIQELQAKISSIPVQPVQESRKELKKHLFPEVAERIENAGGREEFYKNLAEKVSRLEKLGGPIPPDTIANRIAERLEQRRIDREIASLSSGINDLNINDPDAMDTSNLIREIATDDDEYTLQLVRKKK